MKKFAVSLLMCVTLVCMQAQAQTAKQKADEKAYAALYPKLLKMYVGNRTMTLQWLEESPKTKTKFGKVLIKTEEGSPVLSAKGEQRKNDNEFLTIDGTIQPISATEFLFSGTITTQVSYIDEGKPCVKTGNFTFKKYPGRTFYRLQEKENCSGEVNYVDIF